MLWLLTPGNFVLQHFYFLPKALSKHWMGLAPGIVYDSSPEINGMGFAEPALDIDKVRSCWGSCLLCLCQRPATATAKGKGAVSGLKALAHPSWRSSSRGSLLWHKQEHQAGFFIPALPPPLAVFILGGVKFCIDFTSEPALVPALFWIQSFNWYLSGLKWYSG